jgi:hypothetical protein
MTESEAETCLSLMRAQFRSTCAPCALAWECYFRSNCELTDATTAAVSAAVRRVTVA